VEVPVNAPISSLITASTAIPVSIKNFVCAIRRDSSLLNNIVKTFYSFYSEQAPPPVYKYSTYKIVAVVMGKIYRGYVTATLGKIAKRMFLARILKYTLEIPEEQVGLEIYKAYPSTKAFKCIDDNTAPMPPLPIKQQLTQAELTL